MASRSNMFSLSRTIPGGLGDRGEGAGAKIGGVWNTGLETFVGRAIGGATGAWTGAWTGA